MGLLWLYDKFVGHGWYLVSYECFLNWLLYSGKLFVEDP